MLGDARGDDDAVEGGARGPRARHDARLPELEVPQVAVQEHRVELGGVPGAQLGAQARQVLVVDLLGDLAAAGHLRPEAGVRRGRDDPGVDGGGGHSREEDGGAAGQAREARVDDGAPVGQGDQAGAQRRPVGGGGGLPPGGGGPVAVGLGAQGQHAHAGAVHQVAGHAHGRGAGAQVEEPLGPGLDARADLGGPVHGAHEHGGGQGLGERGVDAALGGPLADLVEGGGEQGGVEGDVHGQELAHGLQGAAADLVGVVGRLVGGARALGCGDQGGEVRGGAGDHVGVRVVAQGDGQGVLRGGRLGDQGGQEGVRHAPHRHRRRGRPAAGESGARRPRR